MATYIFDANVDFQPGDVIKVVGKSPLDIVSYNNITIPAGVTINVSATGNYGVAGDADAVSETTTATRAAAWAKSGTRPQRRSRR